MKKITLSISIILLHFAISQAQVVKKTIVEHFTNTKCSVCASRNPGFHANLNANPSVLSISIHPSSPYSTCYLSQQNTVQNDARTNYYGIYGGTPRLVINGSVIPTSQNYGDAAIFNPFISQSNFTIHINQYAVGTDSMRSEISIKRVALGSPNGSASLFAGLVEDTVFGNGGNGETQHFNVLRRTLFTPQGQVINLPTNVGDSVIFNKTENYNSVWNISRMRTVAILQEEVSKQVIQSEISNAMQIGATSLNKINQEISVFTIYPNPANQYVTILTEDQKKYNYQLISQYGQLLQQGVINHGQKMQIAQLKDGVYYVKLFDECKIETKKILVGH